MSDSLVELKGVTKEYGAIKAVDNVNMNVSRGEFLVLLGPSGSGKTTILSMMGGFTAPTSGQLIIDGEDVTEVPPASRPTVTVFQDYALFPHMTVRENVSFGLAMRKVSKSVRYKLAEESLETVGLTGFGDRGIHQLSGGQRQRVALARAIAVEPSVLLLDEPLGALDLKIRRQMQEELVHLQKSLGATFVHVTHDQEEAMSIADNIALINQGRIEDYGPPDRVYLRPATLFAAKFMGDSNIFEGIAVSCEDNRIRVDTQMGQLAFTGEAETGATVHVSLRPEQIRLGNAEGDNMIPLGEIKVSEVIFQGTHRLCHVRAGKGLEVELLLRLPQDHAVSKGDTMNIHARQSDAVLLRD
ncbi:MAG: ABC transporter ATP-binding protein [Rhodospirillales bacterium]|jgi:spermidine/putrescine transport system ATP-binding protein|nr:ABC transporter ATP-binding protein [Rhodospirillales bacterium]MBT4039832.1 ABC transporter ATP-binding protein [Rhodospirillales bacterium]MBT4625978.1 ABC transporter ATP-binding protein [Rhodospirillales bacterium]MBT5350592.1 ABC transporter ATP-binding protein [Rhodospirillales bacterium]MBT5520320.1 ABC transporter ATP-binding protein [Rhodospirillales bacterium]